MQKVLTAAQMREVDRLTTERYGIPSIILMENAAHAVARVITEKLGGSVKGKSILILCGKGNNGGDGAALGRILFAQGAIATSVLFGRVDECQGDARMQFEILKALDNAGTIDFWEVDDYSDGNSETIRQGEFDLVVDALFGTGLTRELGHPFDSLLLDLIERGPTQTLAVDIPSGLNADLAERIGCVLASNWTVTFTAPKPANVLVPVAELGGQLLVANIGSPQELIDEQRPQLFLAEKDDVAEWLSKSEFSNSSYKNKRGHALMISGSRDYTGAAVLCGDAAIRSGVGLVTLAVPESSRDSVVARVSPEVMVRGIAETENGSASEKAFDEITEFSKNVDVIAVGSGLSSKEDETKSFIKRIVDERKMPIVIDADGLTALSPWHEKMKKPAREQGRNQDVDSYALTNVRASAMDEEQPLILTPHEGEFRKLLGLEKEGFEKVIKDRVKAVRDFATEHNVILVLKGERNLIGAPNGNVVVNPTGNPGLGKAGNGDTLTGIITGFIAQAVQMKIDIFETVVAAVYVAGMAGDIAEKKFGKRVMTASDTRECLVEVFAQFEASGSVDS
ncbi:MAG: NAD(P)H-hydrate dehydratase [Pyrinomonadaceae bacterium]